MGWGRYKSTHSWSWHEMGQVVSCVPRLLYSGESIPGTPLTRRLSPRAALAVCGEEKISCPCQELNHSPLVIQSVVWLLHSLHCPPLISLRIALILETNLHNFPITALKPEIILYSPLMSDVRGCHLL